jgi:hypothetical protein
VLRHGVILLEGVVLFGKNCRPPAPDKDEPGRRDVLANGTGERGGPSAKRVRRARAVRHSRGRGPGQMDRARAWPWIPPFTSVIDLDD